MNAGALWPEPEAAWWQVLEIQTKLRQWATDAPDRRFDDLYNLVYDPAVLVTAWERARGNRGVTRYRYRADNIPSPWKSGTTTAAS